ncbi:MAG TPA: hypothetical protein VIR16_09625, partial [Candidatus Limnocylindrales bacterium]
PAGSAVTARYRQAAEAAAVVAATLTPNVVRVYSPDATWPAVRAAVTGASVVVYLGHGNGWPSPYASALMSRTMDGFGLNPVAGVDDVAHQYFGEAFVSKLRLAPGAVVLFSHLCYASGSSEPGMGDGSLSDIVSRVDNYAAPFIEAGASTVVAEGHADPASLIAAAIRGPAATVRAWTGASWGHGNTTSYASSRTPGASLSLDPDNATAGYYRSLVRAPGGARQPSTVQTPGTVTVPVGPPSLASAGTAFGAAVVNGAITPGASATVQLPVTRAAAALPASMLVGVRWLPLVQPLGQAVATTDDGLVVGEAKADVVETATATRTGSSLGVKIDAPTTPGTYVVLMTLQAQDGTPYDVATQALLRPFTVVVPKPIDLRIAAPASVAAPPATPLHLDIVTTNTGTEAWGSPLYASMWSDPALDPVLGQSFSRALTLNVMWLDLANGTAIPAASYPLPRALGAPGGSASVAMDLLTPSTPGNYQLVFSLGVHGSLGNFPQEPLLVPAVIAPDTETQDGLAGGPTSPSPALAPVAPTPTPGYGS